MSKITSPSDRIIKKLLKDPQHAAVLLKRILPQKIKQRLDFSSISIEPTNFISDEFKEGYTDAVVKAEMKSKNGGRIPTDIYFVVEHKTEDIVKVFIQILKYMCFIWEEDCNQKKPLRVLIPVIFYNGENDWGLPGSFIELFNVDEEIKDFLLNFKYVLFDTTPWNFKDKSNDELKEDPFVYSTMVLMKFAYHNDTEGIREVFKFWYEKGFYKNKEQVTMFVAYILWTHKISRDKLKTMLDQCKINGGEIMQTTAQEMEREFLTKYKDTVAQEMQREFLETMGPNLKNEGKYEKAKETAKNLLEMGLEIDKIARATGLPVSQIRKLAAKSRGH